ncbi:MAG: hypothetical protein ABI042_11690 [Verrucomicrobiota bacterium]
MGALEHVKEIALLVKKYQDQDLYQKIVDLRDEIFAIREENLDLKEKFKQLNEAADISTQLIRKGNFYNRKTPEGVESGPYCLACWDGARKLVNVQLFGHGQYQCGVCAPNKFNRSN